MSTSRASARESCLCSIRHTAPGTQCWSPTLHPRGGSRTPATAVCRIGHSENSYTSIWEKMTRTTARSVISAEFHEKGKAIGLSIPHATRSASHRNRIASGTRIVCSHAIG